ncbi:neo-calmodulin-like [Drosophila eugracilis]|uniref:neo-calmodulin-like n=1 Tax=Drosophila eugracilis TaxID=29029 RepID=UPI001BD99B78|nr:neo-calmodulin-like [Drosophila eugracilis]
MEHPEYTLSRDDLEDINEAFALCDPERTGRISPEDLGTVMSALGQNHTESEIYRYSEGLDEMGNGFITLKDFVDLMTKMYKLMDQTDYLKAAFNTFDIDKDGLISYSELRATFYSLGDRMTDEEYDKLFRQFDTDNDGFIDWHDFYNAYKS